MTVTERFLRYILIDTTSDSKKIDTPSTKSQLKFAKQLIEELKSLNMNKIYFDDEKCYVYSILYGDKNYPKIGFISHLDTSENACGKNIKAKIIKDYNGKDVCLNNNVVLSTSLYPDLKSHIGKTLITTDGTTLLGADDKAGIAEIMCMLEYYSKSNEKHGDIYICFTPDEEIGLGTLHFDKNLFNPDFAYTVDGSSVGELSYENFNAASVVIEIDGVSTHLGSAKGIMKNAVRIATIINSLLPNEIPENTENYDGFFHLKNISGNISKAHVEYLIRDFDKDNFEKRKELLLNIVEELNKKYDNCIKISIKDTYYNMYNVIVKESSLISNTKSAIIKAGVTPLVTPIRGGTDGTNISYRGIPCPNLGTGGHNFHSIYEYICIEDMEKASEILISIVKEFSNEENLCKELKK